MPLVYATVVAADIYLAILAVQAFIGAPFLFIGYEPQPNLLLAGALFFIGAPVVTGIIGGLGGMLFARDR